MTSISKTEYNDKLDGIINKCNNPYHITIKMGVKSNTNINSSREINDKDPKFKIVDNVRISKYKNIFAKDYIRNWSEKVFEIKKVKNTVPWTYDLVILEGRKLLQHFTKTNCVKAICKI